MAMSYNRPHSGFPYGGQMVFRGHVALADYAPINHTMLIRYMGGGRMWPLVDIINDNQRYERDVSDWLDHIYLHQPQPKGQSNVSRQSPQDAASGAPVAASPGTFGTNQLAQQQALLSPYASQYPGHINAGNAFGSSGSGGGSGSGGYISVGAIYGTEPACHKPEKLAVGGTVLGEIIGWRGWRIGPQGFLHSMTADVLWAPGEPMDGKVKAGEEHCGIFAYKVGRDFLKKHADGLDVYGKVAMWGRVIEHELGYRSEFAQITELTGLLNTKHGFTIHELRANYGV